MSFNIDNLKAEWRAANPDKAEPTMTDLLLSIHLTQIAERQSMEMKMEKCSKTLICNLLL